MDTAELAGDPGFRSRARVAEGDGEGAREAPLASWFACSTSAWACCNSDWYVARRRRGAQRPRP